MFTHIKRFYRSRFGQDKEFYGSIRKLLGFTPDNIDLYKLALIHRSASVQLPDGTAANNERLEFLGDAVLEAIVSDFLFIEYGSEPEGYLTQMRSRIVSRTSLDDIAKNIGLDRHIVSNFNGSCVHKHLNGNALEAMIGAIYLDRGYDFTNRLIINKILAEHVDLRSVAATESDFKSRLIEWCQKSKREIEFRTSPGADSTVQRPKFVCTILIDGVELGYGKGASKKEAEQKAAYSVMHLMSDEVGDSFLETIDISAERLNNCNGKIN